MHMRGVQPTLTDTMHGVLAINPFPLLTMIVAAVKLRGWFRWYSVATIAIVGATAASAFVLVPAFLAGEPTPWMGVAERTGQYVHQVWHAVFALALLRRSIRAVSELHDDGRVVAQRQELEDLGSANARG
jgi:hypothetical protein